jgi:nucleotide-binding universal stress UspA family protein
MFNIVLVPLDGSKRAESIIPYVEEIVTGRNATVVLLQVIEPGAATVTPYEMVPYYDVELAENWMKESRAYLTGFQAALSAKGIESMVVVEQGPIVRTILDVAEREHVDLIAMASHGRTGLARVFYGSVAAGVLQQADRPLLLVRAPEA